MAPLWENCGPGGTIMETLLILLILPFVSTKTPGGRLSPASSSVFARDALSSQKPIYHLWERDHLLSLFVTVGRQTHNRCWWKLQTALLQHKWVECCSVYRWEWSDLVCVQSQL